MTTPTDHPVLVRRAEPGDAAVVTALNAHVQRLHVDAEPERFTPHDPVAVQEFFADRLSDAGLLWLAEVGGRPVGYLYAELVLRPAGPFTAAVGAVHVHHLAVLPEARRHGAGAALLAAADAHARAHGVEELLLESWVFNEAAHAFFRRQGFVPFLVRSRRAVGPVDGLRPPAH